MKIGVFDSGLGGLIILKSIRETLSKHDIVYLGDTLHLPYGGRSNDAIYDYTKNGVNYLFKEQNCNLVIIACNTASAAALRKIQQQYLPENFPDRRVLGVVIPTLEATIEQHHSKRIGLLATESMVQSNIYQEELAKLSPQIKIFTLSTPLIVPLIEHGGHKWLPEVLKDYTKPLIEKNIEALILGCTHYPFLKPYLKEILPANISIVSQDNIIPYKLADYLKRHPEIDSKIGKNSNTDFFVSDITDNYLITAKNIYGDTIKLDKIALK